MSPALQAAAMAANTSKEHYNGNDSANLPAPAVCLLAVLEHWLQSAEGSTCCNSAGFVFVQDAVRLCTSLKGLLGGSTIPLVQALQICPQDSPFEYDPLHDAVRLRGILERIRVLAENSVMESGGVSLIELLSAAPVVAMLSSIPTKSERMQVLIDAVRASKFMTVKDTWVISRTATDWAPQAAWSLHTRTQMLSADAPVFVPSWQQLDITSKTPKIQAQGNQFLQDTQSKKTCIEGQRTHDFTQTSESCSAAKDDLLLCDDSGLGMKFERLACVDGEMRASLSCASSEPESEASPSEDEDIKSLSSVVGNCREEVEGGTHSAINSVVFKVQQLLEWRTLVNTCGSGVRCCFAVDPSSSMNAQEGSASICARADQSAHELRTSQRMVCANNNLEPQARDGKQLQLSATSWATQQRLRRVGAAGSVDQSVDDEQVVRSIKSILNKLTIEKFVQLSQKLVMCGIRTKEHVELLVHEIFEKATTQHHFVDMYADLCILLHEFFVDNPVGGDSKFSFKRSLLDQSQTSFEQHLALPTGLDQLDREDRALEEIRYKARMVGNIRFIGALLTRRLLASKIMIAILSELLIDPTPEALESAAALLTAVGPTFDAPESGYRPALSAFFAQIKAIAHGGACEPRVKCLLKDVLDLRAGGWQTFRPKRQELPTTLRDVAQKAAAEDAASLAGGHRPHVQQMLAAPAANIQLPKHAIVLHSPKARAVHPPVPVAEATLAQCRPDNMQASLDLSTYHEEVQATFAELRVSHDTADAVARLAVVATPPLPQLSRELSDLFAQVSQEGSAAVRRAGYKTIAHLFLHGHWKSEALLVGMNMFLGDMCEDLRVDVPDLSSILQSELIPAFEPLVKSGLVTKATWSHWLVRMN